MGIHGMVWRRREEGEPGNCRCPQQARQSKIGRSQLLLLRPGPKALGQQERRSGRNDRQEGSTTSPKVRPSHASLGQFQPCSSHKPSNVHSRRGRWSRERTTTRWPASTTYGHDTTNVINTRERQPGTRTASHDALRVQHQLGRRGPTKPTHH